MRVILIVWSALIFGKAVAQIGPPHAGAAGVGGNGGLEDLLPVIAVIVAIVVGVMIVALVLALLKWLFLTLPQMLWRRLREILRG